MANQDMSFLSFQAYLISPGSDDAIKHGCTCPADVNRRGVGHVYLGPCIYNVDANCPLHGLRELERRKKRRGQFINESKFIEDKDDGHVIMPGTDLSWVNLEETELPNANFARANLLGTNLRSADLSYADLTSANLCYVDLSHADLTGANLRGATLAWAELEWATLQGADFTDAILLHANFGNTYLRDAIFDGADLTGTLFYGADIKGADFRGAQVDQLCWPLMEASIGARVDARIAALIAVHLCALDCDDPQFIAMRAALLPFALTSHKSGYLRALLKEDERGEDEDNA